MEFFAIMFVGTVIAILIVAGLRDDHPSQSWHPLTPPLELPKADPGQRNAEIWQYRPMGELEYWEAMDLHVKDPHHNPCPSPVPPKIQNLDC